MLAPTQAKRRVGAYLTGRTALPISLTSRRKPAWESVPSGKGGGL